MEEEIEILKSIYYDDIIKVDLENKQFEILIYPLEDEQDRQKYLRLNMIIHFTSNYPNELPKFEFKHVKGITDEDLETIKNEIKQIAETNLGSQMIFEIIQHIKDKLSTLGVPKSCNCSICLYDFLEQDKDCLNLECYHYFHSKCLVKHMIYMRDLIDRERLEAENNKLKWNKRSISCPVCRNPMKQQEIDHLNELNSKIKLNSNEDSSEQEFQISNSIRQMQAKMKVLFEKQKIAGGIIEEKKEEIIILSRPTNNQNNNELEINSNN